MSKVHLSFPRHYKIDFGWRSLIRFLKFAGSHYFSKRQSPGSKRILPQSTLA
jgi:hypothetical protein